MNGKPVAIHNATTNPVHGTNPFAGLNLTTLAPKAKWGTTMTAEDRRSKVVAKLLRQKKVVAPG
jgi:hypothetical protein